jgi:soluble lytic murein transglycosylase-like protein
MDWFMRRLLLLGLVLMFLTGCMPRLASYGDAPPGDPAGDPAPSASQLERDRLLSYIKKRNPWIQPDAADRIADGILRWSGQLSLDARLVAALIATESSFNPKAKSKVGAMGLGQLMPGTAKDLGVSDAYDIDQNLKGTANYLSWLLRNWQTHPQGRDYALASYNWGIGHMKRQAAAGESLTSAQLGYVRKILTHYENL